MHDDQPTLLPPSTGGFGPETPSGLTPNTRSEAEVAFALNALRQTESAAPTTPLPSQSNMSLDAGASDQTSKSLAHEADGTDEAQESYRRPRGPVRTSSTNYAEALAKARQQSSVSSNLSGNTVDEGDPGSETITGRKLAMSPTGTLPFPAPGQGVVPLHTGVGTGQAEAVKRARPTGLSLAELGRTPSWSEQDMKHVSSAHLMAKPTEDPGYSSSTEAKRADERE